MTHSHHSKLLAPPLISRAALVLLLASLPSQVTAQAPPPRCLTLYSQPNFQGRSLKLCQDADLRKNKSWQNPGSIIVHNGSWTLKEASSNKKKRAQPLSPGRYARADELYNAELLSLRSGPVKENKETKAQLGVLEPIPVHPTLFKICAHIQGELRCLFKDARGQVTLEKAKKHPHSLRLTLHPQGELYKLSPHWSKSECLMPPEDMKAGPALRSNRLEVDLCPSSQSSSRRFAWRLERVKARISLRAAKTNYCLTHSNSIHPRMLPCDQNNLHQRWERISYPIKPIATSRSSK